MRLGYIGLGNMGGGMAKCLAAAGHQVKVHDARREAAAPQLKAGAIWADSPADAAEGSEIVFTSLPGPPVIEEVVYGQKGIAETLQSGSVYVDMSTTSPTQIRRIHNDFKKRGIDVMDAPVSGHITGAWSGTLAIYIGGDKSVLERVRPAFEAMGKFLNYCGPIGAGMIVKLAHNQAAAVLTAALAEAFCMAVKAGVDLEVVYKGVSEGVLGQGKTLALFPNIIFSGKFDITTMGMPLSYAHKDVSIATQVGREFGVPMPIATLVEGDMVSAMNRGEGHKEHTVFVTAQEARAGVALRKS
jgi:3-hydroxyisobutyrate dehydrogenase-like beta-hydroxyacid dehydrogenase